MDVLVDLDVLVQWRVVDVLQSLARVVRGSLTCALEFRLVGAVMHRPLLHAANAIRPNPPVR